MILIGQYDSPFVRRVGIALKLYGMPFEHRPWSVFADSAAVQKINPLMRVPVLVLDSGLALTDSHMILDHLDGEVEVPLFPRSGMARTLALRRAALACGVAEKAVALFYEGQLHDVPSVQWQDRCRGQIVAALDVLERESDADVIGGLRIGHDEIALACALRFVREAHPVLIVPGALPRLSARIAAMEAMPVFAEVSQPFIAPT